jgi:RNA-directed DNA polymerase
MNSIALDSIRKKISGITMAVRGNLERSATHEALVRMTKTEADRVFTAFIDCASESKKSFLTLSKNLIASSDAEALPRLCQLIRYWDTAQKLPQREEHLAIITPISSTFTGDDMVQWLLLGGKPPSLQTVIPFFGSHLELVLNYYSEFIQPRKPTAAETFKVWKILFANQKNAYPFDDQTRHALKTCGFSRGMAPLDSGTFARLPELDRRWILEDNAFSECAIHSELNQQIRENPEKHPDSQESIAISKALYAFGHNQFTSNEITYLLRCHNLDTYSNQIILAIRSRDRQPFSPCDTLIIPDGILTNVNERLALLLTFYAIKDNQDIGKTERLDFLMSLNDEQLKQLLKDIPPSNWSDAICRGDNAQMLRIRGLLDNNLPWIDAVRNLWIKKITSNAFDDCFIDDLIRALKPHQLVTIFFAKPNSFFRHQEHLENQFIRSFLSFSFKSKAAEETLLLLPNSILMALFTATESWCLEICNKILRLLKRTKQPTLKKRVLHVFICHAPGLVDKFFGWKLSLEQFEEVLRIPINSQNEPNMASILRFTSGRGRPLWEAYFRKGKSLRKIRKLIRRYRPDLAHRIVELEAEVLLSKPLFKKKLTSMLTGKDHGSIGVRRSVLQKMLPWVRNKWKKKPTLAVAFEIATAFSIRDGPYLAALCTQRWLALDKTQEGFAFDHLYKTHKIKKKSGGFRDIHAPGFSLKRLQRRILENGFNQIPLHASAHGFRKGRSILTNSLPHVGKLCVVNVDIESFFTSTHYRYIIQAASFLLNGGLSTAAQRIVADLCSYAGTLPTGAPTSPAIGNIVLRAADAAICKAATSNNIQYTRYADDLTFSGEANAIKILPFVKRVLGNLGYKIKDRKTNIYRRGRRQMVTGIVVNDKLNLPRRLRRRLRAAVDHVARGEQPHWNSRPISSQELEGRLSFLRLVQPAEAAKLKHKITISRAES